MTRTDCPICGERFTSAKGARDHTWDVHGACHYCGEGFDDREALYTHWLEVHEGELSRADRKRAETKVGDRTVCPACGERFGSESGVRDHAWEAHGACHHCGAEVGDREALYVHWLAAHEEDLSRADRDRAEAEVGAPTFGDRLAHQGPVGALRGVRVGRRTLVRGGLAGAVVAVGGAVAAGVFDGGDGGGGGGGGDGGRTALGGHPAAAGVARQPALGPPPTEADGTIIAFEDPSCPSCARFERQTFPKIESRLVDAGSVSFVFRAIPIINDWGRAATDDAVLAMEATYARDEAAFWSLKDFYYRNQRELGGGDVLGRTRQFLAGETDVDAAAVIDAVENEAHRGAVDADLRASRNAGVRGTPTFFLFRDGSYVTDVVGPQPYRVFADTLGV